MNKITLLIVDDHSLLRDSWSLVFNNDPMLFVEGTCGSADNAIDLARELQPNVITLDINMPGMSGVEAIPHLTKASPRTKILGVSMHIQPAYAMQMIKKGAAGYITKTSSREETIHAIKEVYAGKRYICREIRDILADQMINGNNECVFLKRNCRKIIHFC
jgi:two-component system invasion response regulator UvrY